MRNKSTRRALAILLTAAMLLANVSAVFAGSFTDVKAGSWYETAVEYCVSNGILSGSDKGFEPDGIVKREECVQALFNLSGSKAADYKALFSDVVKADKFADAVIWGAENKIVEGIGNGLFGSGKEVTREQMVTFLYRYAAPAAVETDMSAFSDANLVSSWAEDAVKWAVASGIINGKGMADGSKCLAPKDAIKRSELAVVMMNFSKLTSEKKLSGKVVSSAANMLKYANIEINIPADDFLKVFALGDMVTVEIEGIATYDVPVCAAYDDVNAGENLLRAAAGKAVVILATNYGQIAVDAGLVENAPEGSETTFKVKDDIKFPLTVNIYEKQTQVTSTVIPDGADMLKYGHIDIDIAADDFLKIFNLGDKVEVALDGYGSCVVPVCASYDDVAAGESLLRAVSGKNYVILAINYGQIALQYGLVEKAAEGAATAYVVKDGVQMPINVTVSLNETAGNNENIIGNLLRTDVRSDYPELTDAQFANFRAVSVSGLKDGVLYRSSSPVNPEIGRNSFADAAAKQAGVKTFINLADTEAEATSYPGYATSYYSAQNHIFLGLPAAFTTDAFKAGLAEGFRFIINNDGPYLVHCTEGKDRAGLTAAILECFAGASYDEVLNDYAVTYTNYYSVENGAQRALTEKEIEACKDIIKANLKLAFGTEINADTDLVSAATAYMQAIGLSDTEIAALRTKLCK